MPSTAPLIPDVPERERVRGLKVIAAELDGIDRRTVKRRAERGRLMLTIDGVVRAVIYLDHRGYWAPKAYLAAYLAQNVRPVTANDVG